MNKSTVQPDRSVFLLNLARALFFICPKSELEDIVFDYSSFDEVHTTPLMAARSLGKPIYPLFLRLLAIAALTAIDFLLVNLTLIPVAVGVCLYAVSFIGWFYALGGKKLFTISDIYRKQSHKGQTGFIAAITAVVALLVLGLLFFLSMMGRVPEDSLLSFGRVLSVCERILYALCTVGSLFFAIMVMLCGYNFIAPFFSCFNGLVLLICISNIMRNLSYINSFYSSLNAALVFYILGAVASAAVFIGFKRIKSRGEKHECTA